MSQGSAIEWTDHTWNPVTGCDRVSPGCDHCYAQTLAKRLKAMGNRRYQVDGEPKTSGPGFGLTLHSDVVDLPDTWKKPRRVFVNSMSDLFHPKVPDQFIGRVWAAMARNPQHQFQILTKRHRRLPTLVTKMVEEHGVLENVWLGVSVEDQEWADRRIPCLIDTPAAVRFLSCEPLLGSVDLCGLLRLPAAGPRGIVYSDPVIHWVIVGGESGHGARPMDSGWVEEIRDQCISDNVAFFFKQWGGRTPKAGGRELDGRTWDEMPVSRTAFPEGKTAA